MYVEVAVFSTELLAGITYVFSFLRCFCRRLSLLSPTLQLIGAYLPLLSLSRA